MSIHYKTDMKRIIVLFAALLCFGSLNAAAQMSDDQVIQYAQSALQSGKSETEIGKELLAKGVTVGLGTDGAAHGGLSLFNEMKIFRSVMNLTRGVALAEPAVMPAKTILSMAFRGGQACLGGEGPDGRILMKDYEILTLDEEKIRREACAYRDQERTAVS